MGSITMCGVVPAAAVLNGVFIENTDIPHAGFDMPLAAFLVQTCPTAPTYDLE